MTEGHPLTTINASNASASTPTAFLFRMALTIIREPLVHFVVLGALLFVFAATKRDRSALQPDRIVVTAGKIEHLSAIFSKTWQRPPTELELRGLVEDFVREEAAYREGKAMGLDQDDTIIRRRIRQKLDFFAEDMASQTEPTEVQLQEYFSSHRESYSTDPQFTFRQIYFDPENHAGDVETEMASLRQKFEADPSLETSEHGDRSLLEHQYRDETLRSISNLFGEQFAASIQSQPMHRWAGPIPSAYGLHLVMIDQKTPGRAQAFEEVRQRVRKDWEQTHRKEQAEQYYRSLIEKYQVQVEWTKAPAEEE